MNPSCDEVPPPPVTVAVTRTGGMAGLRREWRAEPPEDEASTWQSLIERCPWNERTAADAAPGADRYQWRIRARCADEPEQEAELSEDEVVGAWRELVDAVRDWVRSSTEKPSPPRGLE